MIKVFFAVIISSLLCAGENDDPRRVFPMPLIANNFGVNHVLEIERDPNAGRFPVSYSQHNVYVVDGKRLEKPIVIDVDFENEEHDKIKGRIVVLGFEYNKPIGIPENIPEGFKVKIRQCDFHFRNYLFVIAVKQ